MKKLWIFALFLIPVMAKATTYTVIAGGGGDFTTIQNCLNTAVAGDICEVQNGAYTAPTSFPHSGTSGHYIHLTVHSGHTVSINGSMNISGKTYLEITGFNLNGVILGSSTSPHVSIHHNNWTMGHGTAIKYTDEVGGARATDLYIGHNTVHWTDGSSGTDRQPAYVVYANLSLVEYNEAHGGSADFANVGGLHSVYRQNYGYNLNGSTSTEHIDMFQIVGGANVEAKESLWEHNHYYNAINQAHFFQARCSGPAPLCPNLINRFNFSVQNDSDCFAYGNHSDGSATLANGHVYHNTCATEAFSSDNGSCLGFDSGFGVALNNGCYKVETNGQSPSIFTQGGLGKGNIAFNPGYSGSWNSPYSTETTYATFKNIDPQFANYPTDASTASGSGWRGIAVPLTTAVGSGTSSTALTVADAGFFFSGYGIPGVQPDWIRIGPSTTVQIISVDYSTNVIALANPVTWSNGASIYLYKDSEGTVVLNGAAADVGSYQSGGGATYTLTTSKTGTGAGTISGGSISCGVTCTQSGIASGTVISLSATAAGGSTFTGWSGTCSGATGSSSPVSVTITSNCTVVANFNLVVATYTMTVSKTGTGTGTVSGGSISCGATCSQSGITSGTVIAMTASASGGSTFTGWSGTCGGATGSSSPTSITITADCTLVANFDLTATYTLTVTKSGSGSGSVTGGSIICGGTCTQSGLSSGTTITLTATASAGSTFIAWTGTCTNASTGTPTINSNCTVDAQFDTIPPFLTPPAPLGAVFARLVQSIALPKFWIV